MKSYLVCYCITVGIHRQMYHKDIVINIDSDELTANDIEDIRTLIVKERPAICYHEDWEVAITNIIKLDD